jgi:ankyrin repeat protein
MLAAVTSLLVCACAPKFPPIVDAGMQGDDPQLRAMLSNGTPVDQPGPEGSTALYWAALHGRTSTVQLLLDAGANPSARTLRNSTPLEVAVGGKHPDVIRLLVDADAEIDVQSDDQGTSPLMIAASSGQTDVVRLLVSRGANPNLKNRAGQTALFSAVKEDQSEIVAILIKAGADVNAATPKRVTPLHLSASLGRSEAAGILLAAGADPRKAAVDGSTPIEVAYRNGHAALAAMLETAIARRR